MPSGHHSDNNIAILNDGNLVASKSLLSMAFNNFQLSISNFKKSSLPSELVQEIGKDIKNKKLAYKND